jgi:hypothetical protein
MDGLSKKELRRKAFELPLLDDHLIAIGHVAVRSAMLDKLIDLTFATIIQGHTKTIHAELKKLPSPKRITAIKEALIKELPEYSQGISDFISEIFSAREERNDILHRMWRSTDTPEIKALVERYHDKPELEKRRVSPSSMIDTATRLLDLAMELGDWQMQVYVSLTNQERASHDKPHPPIYRPPAPRPSNADRK